MENRIEDVEEIDTLIAELEISRGKGNLILCVVNSPLYRDRIIQTLGERFTSKVIGVTKGKQIIDILKRKDFDGAHILMWNMPEEATEDLLNTLNNYRELFYEGNIPNIVFYNQGFSESVIRKAPDFWRYRGNYYEFKEVERGLTYEALEVLTTPLTFNDKEDLLRRKRINEYLLEKVHDKVEKSDVLNELGIIFHHLGELDKSLEYFQKALELNEKMGRIERTASLFGNIGNVYFTKGELDKALEYFEKSVRLDEELGLKKGRSKQLAGIGNVHLSKGEYDEALEYFEKGLKLDEELGLKKGFGIQLGNIGNVYFRKGELDKALEYFEKAVSLSEELELKIGVAGYLGNIGLIYLNKGELDKALEYFKRALKLNEELGIKEGISRDIGNIGLIYLNKGDLDKALEYFERTFEIIKEIGSRIETSRTLMNIGDIFVLKRDTDQAVDYYLEAQRLAKGSYIIDQINKRLQKLKPEIISKESRDI